ncbi:MAG TPA: sulfotransferase domain-containing protein [Longimicrobiales bacterium]|nr:sulfotransferase domain-containing protein [Longimicrobiales bacterium]
MVVWIASYPRSGNTLFRLVLRHTFGMPTGSVFDEDLLLEEGSAGEVGHVVLPAPLEELAAAPEPWLVKTHRITDAATPHPAVHVVRDGRDALVSCAHFRMRYAQGRRAGALAARLPAPLRRALFRRTLAHMVEGRHYGGWGANVVAWQRRDAPTATVRYEDLLADPVGCAGRALEAVGVPLGPPAAAPPSFASLRARWPGMFRRGEPGAWRDEMPPEIEEAFWRRHAEGMRLLGYA